MIHSNNLYFQIVVTDLHNKKWKYYFPCNQWLAKDEGDGLICRDLVGSSNPMAIRKSKIICVHISFVSEFFRLPGIAPIRENFGHI